MKIYQLLFFVLLSLVLALHACSSLNKQINKSQLVTAQDWIDYSISYHDPKGNWDKFSSSINSYSKVDRGADTLETSQREFLMNNNKSAFGLTMQLQGFDYSVKLDDQQCQSKWENPEMTTEEHKRYIEDCTYGKRYRDYYRYLIGLPMVLNDEAAIISEDIKETKVNGKAVVNITVDYAPIGEHPTWDFYIEKTSGKLIRSRFERYNKEEDKTTGEILDYPEHQLFQGMQMRKKMLWYYLDESFLADETYQYKEQVNR